MSIIRKTHKTEFEMIKMAKYEEIMLKNKIKKLKKENYLK